MAAASNRLSLDARQPDDLVLRLSDAEYALHLGRADFAARLNRYLNAEPVLRARFAAARTVDLRFAGRVVVAPVTTAGEPAALGG